MSRTKAFPIVNSRSMIARLNGDFQGAAETFWTPNLKDEQLIRAMKKAYKIARKIIQLPARSIEDMLIKIRVTGFAMGCEAREMDTWQPSKGLDTDEDEHHVLVSLRDDLRRLKAAA